MKSKRLTYIPLEISHAADTYKLWSNPEVVKFMFCKLKNNINECREWISKILSRSSEINDFVVKYNDEIIGTGGVPCWDKIRGEYGLYYQLGEEYWNRGFGFEIAETLMEYAFLKCNAKIISTYVVTENEGSIKVLEKLGMELSNKRIGEFEKDGKKYDEYNYIITKENWCNNPKT